MPASTPREIAIQWFESVWQSRSREAVNNLMAADAIAHQQGGGMTKGPAEFMDFHTQILSAFPDLSLRVLRTVGDDSQACVHWHVSTTSGEASEDDGTGFTGMSFLTVKDGKITEGWDCWDRSTFMAAVLRAGS
jgi:predicted SnoaL-like aldol condensation-catalyzing enzyme